MGLLDDFRGKEEIRQLKVELSGKSAEISNLQARLVELNRIILVSEQEMPRLERAASDNAKANVATKREIEEAKVAHGLLVIELESLKQSAVERDVHASTNIADLKKKLEDVAPEVAAVKAARDIALDQIRQLRVTFENKELGYKERESKLAEKSEILLHERQKFQQQAIELHTREQHWRNVVEPKLLRYEAHLSLDVREPQFNGLRDQIEGLERNLRVREAELIRRQCTDETLAKREAEIGDWEKLLSGTSAQLDDRSAEIDQKQTEVDERASKLEAWAHELAAFQERAKHLDDEESNILLEAGLLENKQVEQQENHTERLAELRQQRTELRRTAKEIAQREAVLAVVESDSRKALLKAEKAKASATLKLKQAEALNANLRLIEEELKATSLANAGLQKSVEKLNSEASSLRQRLATMAALPLTSKVYEMSVFRDEAVLRWIFKETKPQQLAVKSGYLCTTGNGPWLQDDFKFQLQEQGFNFYRLPDADVEHIIVGSDDWDGRLLLEQIDSRQGESLRVYSQEMWFAMMATGRDPLDEEDPELLQAFGEGHPALEFLMKLEFPWPLLSLGDGGGEVEPPDPDDFVSESPLHKLGYTVGMTSDLSVTGRRQALASCFETKVLEFSDDSSSSYKKSWGASGSAQRLYRIAFHLKSMIDGRVGKDPRKPQSRIDWIADLKWLKLTYYSLLSRRFKWPEVAVR